MKTRPSVVRAKIVSRFLAAALASSGPLLLMASQNAFTQTSTVRVVFAGRILQPKETAAPPLVPAAPMADPSKKTIDELTALRLEAAAKVKEIERVRLLDPALGAVMQTSLSDLNMRIKIAEITVARYDERERERREKEKLNSIQAHELQMLEKQHRNQMELLIHQQDLMRPEISPQVAEKDFFEIWADNLNASAQLNQGIHQLKSTDTQIQADGLRKIGGSIRQISPSK